MGAELRSSKLDPCTYDVNLEYSSLVSPKIRARKLWNSDDSLIHLERIL